MTAAPNCPTCAFTSDATVVYEDPRWIVRSVSPTPAVAGWLIVQARRHVSDISELSVEEADSFGPLLKSLAERLRESTGALRIYTGSLNEGTPHFHTHLLPRLPRMPNDAIGWNAFGLSELARRGEVQADSDEVQRVHDAVRNGLAPSLR
jgi:diadenosine tetraphosphate (Ap4A) HIT family hydrolase